LRSVFLFFGGGGLTQAKQQGSPSDAKASCCGAFASRPADFESRRARANPRARLGLWSCELVCLASWLPGGWGFNFCFGALHTNSGKIVRHASPQVHVFCRSSSSPSASVLFLFSSVFRI
jgi:hypothetical protein